MTLAVSMKASARGIGSEEDVCLDSCSDVEEEGLTMMVGAGWLADVDWLSEFTETVPDPTDVILFDETARGTTV